jgi:pimeloyl-ACP methyl ester carboxylesterase
LTVHSFRIDVAQSVLDDLRERLVRTRFVENVPAHGWDRGTDPAYLKDLCAYWAGAFDWRSQEAKLNSIPQFRADINGAGVHFIHVRGNGDNPIPLLLLHGWPDSFLRFLKVIPLLTNPGAGAQSFDVIAPSLPGFGFSDPPRETGETFKMGDIMHKLMHDELGYDAYAVAGGDFGSMVAEFIGRSHGASVIGLHLTDVPFFHSFQKLKDPTKGEEEYLKKMAAFSEKESAYALQQATRPLSLAPALNDSPAGLAAWMLEKFRNWSDCDGDVETKFTRDELLANITLYWVTQSIATSFAPYFDIANAGPLRWMSEGVKTILAQEHPPAAFALFPKDLVNPPREYAERYFNVTRWTEMPAGGHFGPLEEPENYAKDLAETFSGLRKDSGYRQAANAR